MSKPNEQGKGLGQAKNPFLNLNLNLNLNLSLNLPIQYGI